MRKTLQLLLAFALLLCCFGVNAQKTPEFRTEQLRGAELTLMIDEHHFPYDVSDNGKHVAIQGYGDYPSYYWSEETGIIPMDKGYAFAVSDDGVVAGYFLDETVGEMGVNFAGRWTPETKEWSFIGMNPDADSYIDSEYNGAWAMTNDGSTLAIMQYDGSWDTHSYTWTETDGYTLLPHGNAVGSRPNAISPDAKVVAGRGASDYGYWFACYWVDGEYHDFDEMLQGEAMAVSPNGKYIAGYTGEKRMFLYDIELDEKIVVSDANSEHTYNTTCVTDDGTMFGYRVDVFPPYNDARRAVVYFGGELISFNDYLVMKGVEEAADWTIYSVNSVTSDGRTFVGAAKIDGYDYTFIMTLDEPACQGPTALRYTIDEADNHDDIVLNWTAPEGAEGVTYEIYEDYTSETAVVTGITETTYTFSDMAPGNYSYVVKARWDDCLSFPSNKVKPFVYPCSSNDRCVLTFELYDTYADGWNGAYIRLYNEDSDTEYAVELKSGMSLDVDLSLCPGVYEVEFVSGPFDEEVSFAIYKGDELLYDSAPLGMPEAGKIMKYDLECEEPIELDPYVEVNDAYMFPYDISDNKKHVVIQDFAEGVSYYWSAETGSIYIDGYAFSVSNDGVVAGYYLDRTSLAYLAGMWTVDTREWAPIGEIPGKTLIPGTADSPADYNSAWAMTNNGKTLAISYTDPAWNTESYIWTEAEGYVQLTNGTSKSTRPCAISNDGRVVAGHGVEDLGWTACYWVDGEYREVEGGFGESLSVSSSGDYVGGFMDTGEGFVVNTATGEVDLITSETIIGAFKVVCVNNKGEAFGFYSNAMPPQPSTRIAFAYVGGQVITFNDYLMMNGYDGAQDWMFYSVNAVTADGRTFLCSVDIEGESSTAIITIPENTCEAPQNLTYVIDEEDYRDVILSWTAPKNATDVTYEIYTDVLSETPLYAGITETTYTIEDLEPGKYNFMVKANHGDCLSLPSNGVKPTIYPCLEADMCELTFFMQDMYADAWNSAYIEIVGTKSDMVYTVKMDYSKFTQQLTLRLCPDTYTFTWYSGTWDEEISFAIYNGEDELYSIKFEGMEDTNIGKFLEYELDCGTDVEEIALENVASIIPNPAKNYFNISGVDMIDVEIYNAIGQKVDVVNVNNDYVQINTDRYEAGIYFVKITTADADVIVKKVVVTK